MSSQGIGRVPLRRARRIVTALMIALVVAGCSTAPAPDSALGVRSARTTQVAARSGLLAGPPADPFRGTPADRWADGAAGIAIPSARPIGGFTAAQVGFAYKTTRQMLAAAFLDRETLLGGVPTAFANMLIGQDRAWFLDGLEKKGVDKQDLPVSTRTGIASFAPGEAQLIGGVIKVDGTMSAQASVHDGRAELDVHLDYLFAYPVEPPHQPSRWTRVVVQAKWTLAFGNWAGGATAFEPWVISMRTDRAPIICGATDGYLHPAYPDPAAVIPQPSDSPSGPPVNPYQLGHDMSAACQNTTGT